MLFIAAAGRAVAVVVSAAVALSIATCPTKIRLLYIVAVPSSITTTTGVCKKLSFLV